MFADDTKLYSTIKCVEDATLLQSDLVNLEHWSSTSGLSFNEMKCKQQRITRKVKPITSTFTLNDHQLQTTVIEIKRSWRMCNIKPYMESTSISASKRYKANKMLGYIRRNTTFVTSTVPRRTLYLALVRSHYGYSSPIWAPQTVELISLLERTLRRATKYILNLPFSTDIDYNTRLQYPCNSFPYPTGMNT